MIPLVKKNFTANTFYRFGSNYYGIGFYVNPSYSLEFISTSNSSSIIVYSYDMPNGFTIRDFNGNFIVATLWMGMLIILNLRGYFQ